MTAIVAFSITRLLCTNNGCLTFKQVDQNLKQRITVAKEILFQVLSDDTKFVVVYEEDSSRDLNSIHPDSLIIAKSALRVCQTLNCNGCGDLHMCRYFVCGQCRFG